MSDDLVSRLRQDAEMLQDGPQSNLTKLWHSEVVKDAAKDCQEAATALTEARAEIERLTGERDEARGIVRDTHWMAVRYADGRMSYAPGMCNRAIQKAYGAGWLTYHDHKQHDHDPQYAREGDRPEYRSIEARALAAESELSILRDMLVLCGELGGMQPGETMAAYLRRLIDEVASVESLRARVREVVGPLIGLTEDFKIYGGCVGAARQLMEEVK